MAISAMVRSVDSSKAAAFSMRKDVSHFRGDTPVCRRNSLEKYPRSRFTYLDDAMNTLAEVFSYHRRKETLFNTLDRMLEQRHSFVYHLNVDANYNITELEKDVKTIKVALDMVYAHICEIYNWKHS